MKISNREKNLLIILGLIVVCLGYERTIYTYQRDRINDMTTREEKLKADYNQMLIKINSIKTNETNIKIMNSNVQEKAQCIYPAIEQEKLILDLDRLITAGGIKANISFAENDNSKKNEEDKKPENKSKTVAELQGSKAILNFKGSYDQVMKFLSEVEKNKKLIAVSNLNLNNIGNNELTGSAQLEIYGTKKVNSFNEDFMKWELKNKYGKNNPFDASVGANTIEEALEKNKLKEDFLLSIRPVNSDLPSFMFGKSNDIAKLTYIYSDNNAEEKCELHITSKDNKYYYKYKNSRTSFPLNYNDMGAEFTPAGNNIVLKIFSEARIDLNDKTSVNLNIINDTDKAMQVNIINDDNTNPRVTVTSEKGSVQVIKN